METLRAHLRAPLFHNAYALIAATVLTTGLGLVGSIAAARLYDIEEVGRGQSAVNALIILAGLGNLRLMNVLTRFLPRAGERSAWLVNRCYLLVAVACVVVCAAYFALPAGVLPPVDELLGSTPHPTVWFTLAVVAFALFTLQDGVLTGARQAGWVPLKNGLHGLTKLLLVVVFAVSLPSVGIFASWLVPTVLALVPVNLLIARRLLPANAARPVQPEILSVRRLAPFAAAEYVGALCELAVANLIPLVVAQRLGFRAAGVFGVAWLMGTTLDHIVIHFGSSLTVEGAAEPGRLAALTRDMLRRSMMVVAPIAAGMVVAAPLIMGLFGSEYAARTGTLLSLLGLALVPRLVCIVAVVVARVRSNVAAVVGIQVLLAAGTLGGSAVLLDGVGIAGPGVAYLGTAIAVAALVGPGLLAGLREPDLASLPTRASAGGWRQSRHAGWSVPAGRRRRRILPRMVLPPQSKQARWLRAARVTPPAWTASVPLKGIPAFPVLPLGLGVALLSLAIQQIDRGNPGGSFGLVAVLPMSWWVGAVAVTLGFVRFLVVAPQRCGWLLGHLVILVLALHATPGLVEAHGRFPTAWTHVGFVDQIAETGTVDPGYDARYNWPGAFSFGAFLVDLTGAESARSLVRFAPVAANLLLLVPMSLLVRHVSRDVRIHWMALWLAVVTNWVGQDYLAPQPLALLAYLAVVGVLLRWFRWTGDPTASRFDLLARTRRRLPRLTRDERLVHRVAPPPPASSVQELVLVVAVAAIGAVLAFSHQLTPFVLVLVTAVAVIGGRVNRPLVPVVLGLCTVAWATLGTTSFLRSNLSELAGAVGDVGGLVEDNQARVGPDPARHLVLASRMVLTALAVGLAGLGFCRQWRVGRADWGLVGLVVAPAAVVALNSYGGEVLLRVCVFATPFLAMLGAFAFLREGVGTRATRRASVVFGVVAVLVLPLFVLARYGNEGFERIYSEDMAAWDHLVAQAPPGASVVVPDFAGPWRYRQLRRFEYRVFADEVGGEVDAAAVDRLVSEGEGRSYLVLGTGSARFRTIAEGYPDDWSQDLADELLSRGDYRLVFERGQTRILERMTRDAP